MSSGLIKFKIGEKVNYPQIVCDNEGKHLVQNRTWLIKTIFPVSQIAILLESGCAKPAQVQVSLDRLMALNG
jgi:hypothetical protein